MPTGRPPYYKTPEEFEAKADEYFNSLEDGEPPILTGLTLYLGFADKSSLYDYAGKPEFFHSVKRALTRIEASYEGKIASGIQAAAGPIFALKNFGWKDKQEIEEKGEYKHTFKWDSG